jgi:pimeloyl-ACP methyl ester carboxylesterase
MVRRGSGVRVPSSALVPRTRAPSRSLTPLLIAAALLAAVAWSPPAHAGGTSSAQLSPYRFAEVPGAKLGYRTAGSGRPLVLIAGFGLTAAEWDPALITRLAAKRRVIVFDNRGAGTSGGSVAGLTIRRMAADTAHLIEALKLRRPDVLGWSMGGYIAQELALRHPRRVRRLVLAGTDPGGTQAVQPKAAVNAILENPDTTPDQLLPILFPPGRQAAGGAWFGRIAAQPGLLPESLTVSPATIRAQTKACGPRWAARGRGTWSRLPGLDLPVLVADGTDDVVVPPANSRKLARRIPGAKLRLYPGAGHAFLIQDRARFAAAVHRFLR